MRCGVVSFQLATSPYGCTDLASGTLFVWLCEHCAVSWHGALLAAQCIVLGAPIHAHARTHQLPLARSRTHQHSDTGPHGAYATQWHIHTHTHKKTSFIAHRSRSHCSLSSKKTHIISVWSVFFYRHQNFCFVLVQSEIIRLQAEKVDYYTNIFKHSFLSVDCA